MVARLSMWILWPAFLQACALEVVVFALVDPAELSWRGEALHAPRQAVYTLSFFVFWLLAAAGSALTVLLARPLRALSSRAG